MVSAAQEGNGWTLHRPWGSDNAHIWQTARDSRDEAVTISARDAGLPGGAGLTLNHTRSSMMRVMRLTGVLNTWVMRLRAWAAGGPGGRAQCLFHPGGRHAGQGSPPKAPQGTTSPLCCGDERSLTQKRDLYSNVLTSLTQFTMRSTTCSDRHINVCILSSAFAD